jgi:choline-glycine betaine transporter
MFSKTASKIINYLSYSNKSLGVSLLILMTTLFLQFISISWLLDFAARHLRHPHYIITLPTWLVKLSASEFVFLAFQSAWQLAAAAGVGFCLARIARGLSLRVFFFLVLLTPFLIQLFNFLATQYSQELGIIYWGDVLQKISIYWVNPYILPGAALAILAICLLRLDGTSELLRLSLSNIPYEIRRIPTNLLRGLIYNITLLILISWTGGVDIILISNIVMVVPIIVVAMMIISSFMKSLIVK